MTLCADDTIESGDKYREVDDCSSTETENVPAEWIGCRVGDLEDATHGFRRLFTREDSK